MGNGGACGAAQKRSRERGGGAGRSISPSPPLSLSLSLGAVDLIHPRVHLAAPPGAVAGGREGERGEIWFPCRSRNDARNLRRETPPIPSPPSLPLMQWMPVLPPRRARVPTKKRRQKISMAVRCGAGGHTFFNLAGS